jgi:predicted membrane channel-forming protein YqfA (hemolysin III family)
MLRPKRDEEKPSVNFFNKFARYFGMLMTLVYVALGLFIMFMDDELYNLDMSQTARMLFGGTLILYGVVRFVRAYQINNKSKRNRYND